MSIVSNILAVLICASPITLLWDGLIVQGVIAGLAAIALAAAAWTLRPGETAFLISVSRVVLIAAMLPAAWMVFQIIPLEPFAHPIWRSAQTALNQRMLGAISADPSITMIALGRYLCTIAIAFLSAAVAVERHRAKRILLALNVAVAIISMLVILHNLFLPDLLPSAAARIGAIDCAQLGIIIAAASCIRDTGPDGSRQEGALTGLLQSSIPGCVALGLCAAAFVGTGIGLVFATALGLVAFICITILRLSRFGMPGITTIVVSALAISAFFMITRPTPTPGLSAPLAFAEDGGPPLTALSQRVLDDVSPLGAGAGTFAALAPIYRELRDPAAGPTAASTAATFAIELGRPMLWLITATTVVFAIVLLRASLQRGRDSFYAAMGGSCLITVLLTAFLNGGLVDTAPTLITATVLGLAVAQSKSRMARA